MLAIVLSTTIDHDFNSVEVVVLVFAAAAAMESYLLEDLAAAAVTEVSGTRVDPLCHGHGQEGSSRLLSRWQQEG